MVCKQGKLREGTAAVTLERGEEYVGEDAARSGVQMDVREYVAA